MVETIHDMAIIADPKFGMLEDGDALVASLSFLVYMAASKTALIIFRENEALRFVRKHSIMNIAALHGRLCIVQHQGFGTEVEFSSFIDPADVEDVKKIGERISGNV